MRIRRNYVVMTFRTTTAAMAMEKQCGRQQIPGRLIPVPGSIRAGCGLAWRMLPEDYEQYRQPIEALGIECEQITEAVL